MPRTEVQIYKDSSIVSNDIAIDAITTEKIKNKNVTIDKLSDDISLVINSPYPFTTRGFNIPF